jgi:sRNA-binding carbon storage regulator CsrA
MSKEKEFGSLAITMREGEVAQIGEEILVLVEKINQSKTMVVIRAPKDIKIFRLGRIGKQMKGKVYDNKK